MAASWRMVVALPDPTSKVSEREHSQLPFGNGFSYVVNKHEVAEYFAVLIKRDRLFRLGQLRKQRNNTCVSIVRDCPGPYTF